MANKVEKVAELTGLFQNSNAVFLTEYRGLTVGQLKELRRSISANASYAVAKNTLIEIAAKNANVNAFDGQLFGPSALAFAHGDAVSVAKALRDFAKANPLLVVKSGILDGVALTAAEVQKLADLETREVLLAKAAGLFKASMYKAAATIQAPLSKTVRTVEALRAKQAA